MKNIALTFVLLFLSHTLLAWGPNGHRIVARICYDNLSDDTRKEIDKILGDNYLTQVATWPDYIRSEKKWNFIKPWHYVTIDPSKTIAQIITEGKTNDKVENVIEAIELMKAILKGDADATSKFEKLMADNSVEPLSGSVKATALAFLVHFIGDIHQPMHVSKNKDNGGNNIKVLFFSERKSIHSVWDSGIIEQEQLSFTEFADFAEKHNKANKAKWQKADIKTWATESAEAREDIYNTLFTKTDRETGLPNLSYNYQHDFLPVVERRLGAAGYRAAAVLNAIL